MQTSNKKILMFITRKLCYSSAAFFTARIASVFEERGAEVEICEIETDEQNGAEISEVSCRKLENYIGKSFFAVIDFNSKLPKMIMDDGSYYIDNIKAPFYNYILDNPLYHHLPLSCRLKDYNVILVDKNHCDYVRKYYSHIKKIIFSPLAADVAVNKTSYDSKIENVLFTATYRNPEDYLTMIMSGDYLEENDVFLEHRELKRTVSEIMKNMLDIMLNDTRITMEEALCTVLPSNMNSEESKYYVYHFGNTASICELDKGRRWKFNELMNYVYPVEMYLRNYYRKKLVDEFVKEHMKLKIVGDWWDRYEYIDSDAIIWEKPVGFSRSFDVIAKNSIMLDSSPFFKRGIHDRVFAGMANKTAVLTDYNSYKCGYNEEYKNSDNQDIYKMYDVCDVKDCVNKAEELLINKQLRREMVDKAYDIYEKDCTWNNVADRILQL